MKIVIASDHAGYELKQHIKETLNKVDFIDVGTTSTESVDYPDFAHQAVSVFNKNKHEKIILICGSGNGINMTANKYSNIRSALCWSDEIARLARLHNDANSLALPARYITNEEAVKIVNVFITTLFEEGRHQRRKEKISCV